MKTIMKINKIVVLAALILLPALALAQEAFKISEQGLQLKVKGTSTVHDWEMISNKAAGDATINLEGKALKAIDNLNFKMEVSTLKSGKSGMDDNAYKALKADKFPSLSFQLKEVKPKGGNAIEVNGILTIAGVSKPTTFNGTYTSDGNKLGFVGNSKIKFTDFKIDPPTAVFGTIKTGNDLDLEVNITYIKKQ